MSYVIQFFQGYADGKPSWRKEFTDHLWSKEQADAKLAELTKKNPKDKFRIRKKAKRT